MNGAQLIITTMGNIKTNNTALHGPLRFILLHQCNKIYNKKKDPRGRPRRFTLEYIIVYILKAICPWSMLPVEGVFICMVQSILRRQYI